MPLRLPSAEHFARSGASFWARLAGTAGAADAWFAAAFCMSAMPELAAKQKHILIVWMAGGVSQLESWDPKPKTDTGGPFRAIPTSVPGLHISELLPYTAKQMHHLSVVRSVNTKENDHGKGAYCMTTGRRQEPVADYPHLGAVGAKLLAPDDSPLPGHIHVSAGGGGGGAQRRRVSGPQVCQHHAGRRQSAPQHGLARGRHRRARRAAQRVSCPRERPLRPAAAHGRKRRVSLVVRSGPAVDGAARRVRRQPRSRPPTRERYGNSEFGRHCLLARRLLEQGVSCVQVTHSNYDTHHENFDFHIEQLGEFDQLVRHAGRRPGRARTVGQHAVGRDVGVRPHAANQQPLWPRSLGHRLERRAGRLRHPARRRHRQDQRQRHRSGRPRKSTTATCFIPTCKPWASIRRPSSTPRGARFRWPIRPPNPSRSCWHERRRKKRYARESRARENSSRRRVEVREPLALLSLRPQRQFVFCSAQDNTIQRWNIASGEAVPLVGHDSWVRGAGVSSLGKPSVQWRL